MKELVCSFLSCNLVYLKKDEIICKLTKEIDLLIENEIKHFIISPILYDLGYDYEDYLVKKKRKQSDIIIDMYLQNLNGSSEYFKKYSKYVNTVKELLVKKQPGYLSDCYNTIIDKSDIVIVGFEKDIKIRKTNLMPIFANYAMYNDKLVKFICA